jgi:hypothetical protein
MGRATQMERIISKGQLVGLTFMQDAVAASQTNVQLPIAEVAAGAANGVAGYIAPFDGEIVAISWILTAAGTAGVFTIGPTIGGTEDADLTQTVGTAASGRAKAARGAIPFSAGDEIGAEITTDGSWDGTSSDLGVTVWVLLHMEGI